MILTHASTIMYKFQQNGFAKYGKYSFLRHLTLASVPGFSSMQYGCGAENTAKKKKSLVDFDHVGTVTCNGMQFCHTSYLGVK